MYLHDCLLRTWYIVGADSRGTINICPGLPGTEFPRIQDFSVLKPGQGGRCLADPSGPTGPGFHELGPLPGREQGLCSRGKGLLCAHQPWLSGGDSPSHQGSRRSRSQTNSVVPTTSIYYHAALEVRGPTQTNGANSKWRAAPIGR